MSRDGSLSKRQSESGPHSPSMVGGLGGGLEHDPDVIVLDIGTGSIKVGWGGEDAPRVVVPTLLLDHQGQAMPAAAAMSMDQHHAERNEYAVGHAALQALHLSSTRLGNNASNNLTLLRPVQRGEIRDYDSMQKILDHIFKHELRVNPKDHPVMLTVSPLCSPESRAELAKLMFDVFAVPSLCMANQAVLSLYSTGRTTGIVLELGEGMCFAVPVYEGFALRHAVLSIPVAGADLTAFLGKSLGERGWASMDASSGGGGSGGGMGGGGMGGGGGGGNPAQADTVRDIKEKLCRVKGSKWEYNVVPIPSSNAATAVAQASSAAAPAAGAGDSSMDETSYELPDGQMIRLDEHCRFNTLEILFSPEKYAQAMGLHLSGGVNLCYGVPASAAAAGGGVSGAAGGGPPGSAGGLGSATSGSGSGAGGSGPPTPSTNIPAGLRDFSSFSSQGGLRPGAQQGPSTIDLSTNDLIGVHLMLHHSLGMCDSFLRRELLKNIVLAGGTSMARGFGERMRRELQALLAQDAAIAQAQAGGSTAAQAAAASGGGDDGGANDGSGAAALPALNIITDSQRKFAAWIGASMYASLPTFNIIKITAEQYKRDENIVHKKFF